VVNPLSAPARDFQKWTRLCAQKWKPSFSSEHRAMEENQRVVFWIGSFLQVIEVALRATGIEPLLIGGQEGKPP